MSILCLLFFHELPLGFILANCYGGFLLHSRAMDKVGGGALLWERKGDTRYACHPTGGGMQLHRPYMMVARAPAQSIIADCTEGEIYDEIAFLATKARCA